MYIPPFNLKNFSINPKNNPYNTPINNPKFPKLAYDSPGIVTAGWVVSGQPIPFVISATPYHSGFDV